MSPEPDGQIVPREPSSLTGAVLREMAADFPPCPRCSLFSIRHLNFPELRRGLRSKRFFLMRGCSHAAELGNEWNDEAEFRTAWRTKVDKLLAEMRAEEERVFAARTAREANPQLKA